MDIFEANIQSVWLATIVSTKVMLAGMLDWESTITEDRRKWCVATFQKRIMDFQKYIIIPNTAKLLSGDANTPKHLIGIINNFHNSPEQDIFAFHVNLLNASSSEIIKCITHYGVGKDTFPEVVEWFEMMKAMTKIESFRRNIDQSSMNAFKGMIHTFKNCTMNEESVKEYPLFSHKSLFIHVAYIVHHHSFGQEQNIGNADVSTYDYEQWEESSGKWCSQLLFHDIPFGMSAVSLFNKESEEQNNKDNEDNEDNEEWDSQDDDIHLEDNVLFVLTRLPYQWLAEHMRKKKKMVSPHELFVFIMSLVHCQYDQLVKSKSSHNIDDTDCTVIGDFYDLISEHGFTALERYQILRLREKISKCEEKKRKRKGLISYKPRHGGIYERDVFIMGTHSHYHQCNTEYGKVYTKLNRYYESAMSYYNSGQK